MGGLLSGLLDPIFGTPPTEQTTTTKSDPWGPIQPHLLDYYNATGNWARSAMTPYDMVAGLTPEQLTGMGLINQRAMAGSPLTGMAQQQAYDTLSGRSGQMAFNPLFDTAARRMGETFRDITMPAISGRFGGAGRGGSGLEKEMYGRAMGELGTGLGDMAANIYGQERGFQMGLIPQAQGMADWDYGDMGRMMGVGDMRRQYAQQLIDAPGGRLSQWGNLMGPGMGFGTNVETQPINRNPIGSIMGGAAAGYGIGGGWGAVAGGGLGLLGGMGY